MDPMSVSNTLMTISDTLFLIYFLEKILLHLENIITAL
ncbi:Uncharacterised protein [Bartonella grahamii]|uniref:Uncharacterized protein n=1 Tax=Bartonella grahamii TaxID=33045 RepID=A0A336NLD1_BARGR|nr:Uncharacterised protein [Bartonella grahamii]